MINYFLCFGYVLRDGKFYTETLKLHRELRMQIKRHYWYNFSKITLFCSYFLAKYLCSYFIAVYQGNDIPLCSWVLRNSNHHWTQSPGGETREALQLYKLRESNNESTLNPLTVQALGGGYDPWQFPCCPAFQAIRVYVAIMQNILETMMQVFPLPFKAPTFKSFHVSLRHL